MLKENLWCDPGPLGEVEKSADVEICNKERK